MDWVTSKLVLGCLLAGFSGAIFAQAYPQKDVAGVADPAGLKRYEGSVLLGRRASAFDEFKVALSPVMGPAEKVQARQSKPIEGAVTYLVYGVPQGRSTLEAIRNYRDDIVKAGGEVLFECGEKACFAKNGDGKALARITVPFGKMTEEVAVCALGQNQGGLALGDAFAEPRYFAARMASGAHVAVNSYRLKSPYYCTNFNDRVFVTVVLVEPKSMENKMVTVKAEEMAKAIADTGRVALYGIYFDTNKFDIKPESAPALQEIGKLMKSDPKLRLHVVGHTDNVGSADANMQLSKRRADAVVAELVKSHGVAVARLTANGVGYLAPVASNKDEPGRAKNRRVELVPQ